MTTEGGTMEFLDDDAGYVSWIGAHPQGFVLNCDRTPRAEYLVLHQAGCPTISSKEPNGRPKHWPDHWSWTTYRKVCSSEPEVLQRWAHDRTGADVSRCSRCTPSSPTIGLRYPHRSSLCLSVAVHCMPLPHR